MKLKADKSAGRLRWLPWCLVSMVGCFWVLQLAFAIVGVETARKVGLPMSQALLFGALYAWIYLCDGLVVRRIPVELPGMHGLHHA